MTRHEDVIFAKLMYHEPSEHIDPPNYHLLSAFMVRKTVHEQVTDAFIMSMALQCLLLPPKTAEEHAERLGLDIATLIAIAQTRYLNGRPPVLKIGNLHLAWAYAQSPSDHQRFVNMLRVTPEVFQFILNLIDENEIFFNGSTNGQAPVEQQLAVTLYRMGRFGNAASLEDIARTAGCSEGSVENYTARCFDAIEEFHSVFVRQLTPEEKEAEKKWMDEHLGFVGLWREGWIMYDGTIVVLYAKPGLNGGCVLHTKGKLWAQCSAHDALAFAGTAAARNPDWFFEGEEFAWGDSTYTVNSRTISVNKKPAALDPDNTIFDKTLSRLRVRSEHCMGALKGRWQCLRGLRLSINSNREHIAACRWVTIATILHNIVVRVGGEEFGAHFAAAHGETEEREDRGDAHQPLGDATDDTKRRRLVAEIVAFKNGN
ncbi:DDE Tnp4 domain-containing protein [Mycena sanguinolenta]|uniref:DDE Tnp4 domain-containing protein n=1 Tax=Mycena sanguinolenta TaxID=230812 RepID=A0A8H7DDL2_9AGAR|nr:DDE Tnp4 domain-containing protein [Mycena sanguinolenta]